MSFVYGNGKKTIKNSKKKENYTAGKTQKRFLEDMRMENLIEEFKRKMYLDGKSKRTVEVYGNSVKEYLHWFYESYGNVEFKKLYRENILEYKSYLKNIKKSAHSGNNLCPKTINSKLSALICFNELMEPNNIVVSKRDLIKIQVEMVSPTSITKKEVESFRQIVLSSEGCAARRNFAIVTILAYAGLRISECLNFRKSDICLESNQLKVVILSLNSYRQRYYRCMRSEKHMPEGGICSLDSPINKENEEKGDIGALVGKSLDIERNLVDQETFKEFTDIICKFPYGRQMKVVLCLLMEGYAEKEIIKYIQECFVCWEFDRKQLDFLMRQLRLAFREAGLDNNFMKVSLCNIVYYNILDYAIKEKIIKRQGAKLLYNDKAIGKGRGEGKRYLEEHQSEVSEIMDKIKSKYLCAG